MTPGRQGYEIVIGLETHTQLSTASKIFSGSSTAFGAAPNTQASAVDLALPGTLPVLNRGAVERAIRFGLAIGATIAPVSIFARKNYFYPDLPKGYQISQYEIPVVQGGELSFMVPETGKTHSVRLTRAHLEEDAGKSLHEDYHGMTGIDLNRAGTPLLEIVSEPDMRSSAEAVAYAKTLHALVVWLGICDGNMQEGSFRCDANVSVRPAGSSALGTRCEIKNLNSFKFMQQAIDYEVRRQIALIEDGGAVIQETRLFDPDRGETRPMRSKEDAHDYRYFPDPDLPPLVIAADWIARVREDMPELPWELREHLVSRYGLSRDDAYALTASREVAQYFEGVCMHGPLDESGFPANPKLVANWVMGEVLAKLNEDGLSRCNVGVIDEALGRIITLIHNGKINTKTAKDLFAELWMKGKSTGNTSHSSEVDRIIAERGLEQISDTGALEIVIDDILAKSPSQLADYRAGKEKLFGFFVGQAMKATEGKANPQQLNELLKRKLAG